MDLFNGETRPTSLFPLQLRGAANGRGSDPGMFIAGQNRRSTQAACIEAALSRREVSVLRRGAFFKDFALTEPRPG